MKVFRIPASSGYCQMFDIACILIQRCTADSWTDGDRQRGRHRDRKTERDRLKQLKIPKTKAFLNS